MTVPSFPGLKQAAIEDPKMFHQTIFYPANSAGNIAGMPTALSSSNAASTTAASNKKASTFMDLRKQYFVESKSERSGLRSFATKQDFQESKSERSGLRSFATMTTIGEYHITPIKPAPPGFGAFLTPLGLPPKSPMFSSPEKDYPKRRKSDGFIGLKPKQFFGSPNRNRAVSDADTATTVSIATSASSPTPSFHTSPLCVEDGGEAKRIEFVLDEDEDIADWISNSDSRGSELDEELDIIDLQAREFSTEELENNEYEYEDGDDEICSCSTPVLTNTSRPHQIMRRQHSVLSMKEESAVMTTKTTETKTTTTTTTQTTTSSSVSTSELVSSTAIVRTISEKDLAHLDQQGDLPCASIQPKINNNDIAALSQHQHYETNPALATSTESIVPAEDSSCPCKPCASKQRLIDRQRKELRHMKGMMTKLCLLLADTVSAQEDNRIKDDESKRLALDPSTAKSMVITNGSNTEIISSTSSDNRTGDTENSDEGDSSSSVTTSTALTSSTSYASTSSSSLASMTSSKFVPLVHRPRIVSLPITRVGKDCPRIKNQRIQVSGHWGSYSGPSLLGEQKPCDTESKDESKDDNEIEEESDAGIFMGCVVRLDDTSLYVGSLSRNDTGSFIFHPPGTLYDHAGKAVRRIR